MKPGLFSNTNTVQSDRILYTPSSFARSSLFHLQEVGTLRALFPHISSRSGLASYLFFTVLSGFGELTYEGQNYELSAGDCVFIDCKKGYRHRTGAVQEGGSHQTDGISGLWSLSWCHFYGSNMSSVYKKYQERGGAAVFHPKQSSGVGKYEAALGELYRIADSADYVRDMRIHEKLSSLLVLLMEDAWLSRDSAAGKSTDESGSTHAAANIQKVKEYLDNHFKKKLTLDELSSQFFINKYYLMSLFKERYGVTVNAYLNQVRVTYVKQNLRFTEKTVEALAIELNIEPTYLSRLFKKVEGVTPSEYRKQWNESRSGASKK